MNISSLHTLDKAPSALRVWIAAISWLFMASILLFPRPALGGHDSGACFYGYRQGTAVGEPGYPVGRNGVFGYLRAISPVPGPEPRQAIVRSVYIQRNKHNGLELGWKWNRDDELANPQEGRSLDPDPTVFVVRQLRGDYTILEGSQSSPPSGDASNPGWGLLPPGTTHSFRIVRDDGPGTGIRYRFERDDLLVGWLKQSRMPRGGAVHTASEAIATCDSLYTDNHDIKRSVGPHQTLDWGNWTGVSKGSDDDSFYWYFARNPEVDNAYRLRHCIVRDCPDQVDDGT